MQLYIKRKSKPKKKVIKVIPIHDQKIIGKKISLIEVCNWPKKYQENISIFSKKKI